MEKEKIQKLTENEKGQLQGGFAIAGSGESNFFNTNTNCKCVGCNAGTIVISRPRP